MKSKGSPSIEELFLPFLRKIKGFKGRLSSNFISEIEKSLEVITPTLHALKGWEEQVKNDIAKSIKSIDDLNENYNDIEEGVSEVHKVSDIINECVEKIKLKVLGLSWPKNEREVEQRDEKQDSIQLEHWLETAEKNMEGGPVIGPEMRYEDLETLLQRCLLCLSVFPENAVIKKRTLIYWWIGEGLVKPTKRQTAEQVGEECFKMLLLNGLILPLSKKHDETARCCKLHSEVRQMLISNATKDGLFEIYSKQRLTAKDRDDKFPLACLDATENEQSVAVSQDNTGGLLSLFNVNAQYLICEKEFTKFNSIKVLQLGRWQISANHHIEIEDTKFLDSLVDIKHLKYLSLQGISRITMLPHSLEHLTNLHILDLRACHNLEKIPDGISSLKNLTHLDVSECSLLDKMPKGLGSLSELQVLKGFIISSSRIPDSCRLKDLDGLKKLRKLSINIASEAQADEDLGELKKFTSLRALTIAWGRVTRTKVESSLPDLEKLDLQCIQLEKLLWLNPVKFPKLKKLYIRGGKLKTLNLGTEAERWTLETLRLKFLRELEWNDWSKLQQAIPSLACIEIHECPKLKEKPTSLPPLDEDGIWIKNKASSSDKPSSSSSSRDIMN